MNVAVMLKALPPHLRNLMVTQRGTAHAGSGPGAAAAAARAAFSRQTQNQGPLQARRRLPTRTPLALSHVLRFIQCSIRAGHSAALVLVMVSC